VQLFSLRRFLLAPDLAVKAVVEVLEKFLLIGAQRLARDRIESGDRMVPRRRKLPVGRGNLGVGASRQLARGARPCRNRTTARRRRAGLRTQVPAAAKVPAERRCGAYRGDPLFLQQQLALLDQPVELFLLLGDPVGIAVLVLGARERGSLLDELADVVARNGDALLEFGK
jgi:hypothetical protein